MPDQEDEMPHRPPSRPDSGASRRIRPTGEAAPPRHDVIEERMRPVKLAGKLFE